MVRKSVGMSGGYIGRGICRRRGENFHGVVGGEGVAIGKNGEISIANRSSQGGVGRWRVGVVKGLKGGYYGWISSRR